MKKHIIITILIIAVLTIINPVIEKNRVYIVKGKEITKELTPSDLIMELLGSFRTTAASYLWITVEHYHHEYEWAGGSWKKDITFMPLIKLITTLDPHFAAAYDFGGYHLAVNLHKVQEGMDFLNEGLKNNPDSYELNFTMGYIYFFVLKDYQTSYNYLAKAVKFTKDKVNRKNALDLMAHDMDILGRYREALYIYSIILNAYPEYNIITAFQMKRLKEKIKKLEEKK